MQINGFYCVEVAGFEPAAFWSRTKRATKLRYTSIRGAAEGTRTPDLLITNRLLYQLSHIGTTSDGYYIKGKGFCPVLIFWKFEQLKFGFQGEQGYGKRKSLQILVKNKPGAKIKRRNGEKGSGALKKTDPGREKKRGSGCQRKTRIRGNDFDFLQYQAK